MSKKSPEARVDDFLSSTAAQRHRGGGACRTCAHPKHDEINRMLRRFAEARKSGATSVPWRTFAQLAIIKDPEIKFAYKWRAILKHAEDCLELELS